MKSSILYSSIYCFMQQVRIIGNLLSAQLMTNLDMYAVSSLDIPLYMTIIDHSLIAKLSGNMQK